MGVRIVGTGSFIPEKVLTNLDLQNMVDTSDEYENYSSSIEHNYPNRSNPFKKPAPSYEESEISDYDSVDPRSKQKKKGTPKSVPHDKQKRGTFVPRFLHQASCLITSLPS